MKQPRGDTRGQVQERDPVFLLYTVWLLLVKSTRRADTRRRRNSLDSFSICGCWASRAKSRLTHLIQAHAGASRSSGGVFVSFPSSRRFPGSHHVKKDLPAWHPDSKPSRSPRTDLRDGFTCESITRSGDGWRTPPARQVDARAFLAYAGPMANGRELLGRRSPTLAPSKGR